MIILSFQKTQRLNICCSGPPKLLKPIQNVRNSKLRLIIPYELMIHLKISLTVINWWFNKQCFEHLFFQVSLPANSSKNISVETTGLAGHVIIVTNTTNNFTKWVLISFNLCFPFIQQKPAPIQACSNFRFQLSERFSWGNIARAENNFPKFIKCYNIHQIWQYSCCETFYLTSPEMKKNLIWQYSARLHWMRQYWSNMTIFCQLSADMSSYSGSREVSVSEISTLAIFYFSIVNKIEDLALPKISMKANCSKDPKGSKVKRYEGCIQSTISN